MKKTILITGGFGFLGTILIEKLLAKSESLGIGKITILDSLVFKDQGPLAILRDPRVEIVIGDVRDKELLAKLSKEADVIYPLAALVGAPICAKYPKEAIDINQTQIQTIVDAARPETKIIVATTNSLYGKSDGKVTEESPIRPLSIYAQTKQVAEEIILKRGGVSLRLATLAGVSFRQRKDLLVNTMCLKSISDGYVILYEPNFMRCYISVDDAARAFVHCLENYDKFAGQAYNCGNTSLNCSKLQLAEKIKEYVPNFVIKVDDYQKDGDQRNYWVENTKLESTSFQCKEGWDAIIPQVLKAYKVLLDTENYMLT